MIICSCNVLSEAQVLDTLRHESGTRVRSVGEAYRCLGCAPRCGRCLETVRKLAAQAHLENCEVGCPTCPAVKESDEAVFPDAVVLIAAE